MIRSQLAKNVVRYGKNVDTTNETAVVPLKISRKVTEIQMYFGAGDITGYNFFRVEALAT